MARRSVPDAHKVQAHVRWLVLGGSLLIGLVAFGAFMWSTRRSARSLEELGDFHAPAASLVEDLRAKMAEAVEEAFAYLVLDDVGEKEEFLAWIPRFEGQLAHFRELEVGSQAEGLQVDLANQLELDQRELVAGARTMFDDFERLGEPHCPSVVAFEHAVDDALTCVAALLELERAELLESHEAARRTIGDTRIAAVWTGTLVLVLSLILGLVLSQLTAREVRAAIVRRTRLATIGQVSASIAHELRNPLGVIRNAVYYLKRNRPSGEKLTEYHELIEHEIDVATTIIHNLTEMARSRAPVRQSVDLRAALLESAQRCALDVDVRLEPDPFEVQADPAQLRQVFGNLMLNAAQVMPEGGRVEVTARRTARDDLIEVRDNGPGIAAEDAERLFEPLYSTKAKGTGLGLTISRQIVERHEGSLELLRTGSEGSTFEIRLPRSANPIQNESAVG